MRLYPVGCVATLILAFLLTPCAANAESSGKVYRIGVFHVGLDHVPPALDTLREGLRQLGYEEGKNLRLDWRNLPDEGTARETAQAFVHDRVDLIVAFENQTIRAAQAATAEVPTVFIGASDPVADGFVHSLARPGGNLTGFALGLWDFQDKKLELFKELIPQLRRVLVLSDPDEPVTPRLLVEIRRAGAALQLHMVEREATQQADVERVFASVTTNEVDGVFVVSPSLGVKFSSHLVRLASEKHLPLMSHRKEWVAQGALFSYALDQRSIGRQAAQYVDKLLQGAKPADLPVQRPTTFELVINLRTAHALGLTIPPTLLLQADEVIR
jgi:putative ABC transport system substrate-binding protein